MERAQITPITAESLPTLSGHTGIVYNVVFNRASTQIVTARADQTAKVWDAASGQLRLTLRGRAGEVYNADYNLDGTRIITASADHIVKIWDAASGALLQTLP